MMLGAPAKASAAGARRSRSRCLHFLPKSTSKQERQQHASGHGQTNAHQWGRRGASAIALAVDRTIAPALAHRRVSCLSKGEIAHQRNCQHGRAAEDSKRLHRKSPHHVLVIVLVIVPRSILWPVYNRKGKGALHLGASGFRTRVF